MKHGTFTGIAKNRFVKPQLAISTEVGDFYDLDETPDTDNEKDTLSIEKESYTKDFED